MTTQSDHEYYERWIAVSSGLPVGHPRYKPFVVDQSKALATFGDVDFLNHGGQLLIPNADGDPYLEIIEPPTDDEARDGDWLPDAKWTIYRYEPEQMQLVERDHHVYLVGASWKPDWPGPLTVRDEWFHKDLEATAEHEGVDLQELRSWFCSEDPIERARAYLAVAAVHGWFEFDQYPLTLTQAEVLARYGEESL